MMNLRSILSVSLAVSLGAAVTSCTSFSSGAGNGSGGSSATGSGGDNGSGGDSSTGGDTGTGGDTSTGGSTGTGGAVSSGGTTGTGGATASGGTTGTGGATASGGATGTGGVTASGGATGTGGVTASGGATGTGGAKGGTTGTGGAAAGAPGTGGTASGGTTGTGGTPATGGATGTGGTTVAATPCSILAAAGNTCVAAHSTVRVIYPGYTGPLYQVCKGTAGTGPNSCSSGTTMDIGSTGGFANAAAQDTFCGSSTCSISIIYDQSPMKNDLKVAPSGGAKPTADSPASATALKLTLSGHSVYGVLIKPNQGYRAGCTGCGVVTPKGTATGDAAETEYMVTSQNNLVDSCCFDYGNAETDSHDDGNGTMEAVYFGGGVVWGTGSPGGHTNGPWVMADLENGLYAGWENSQDQNISTNTPSKSNYVTAVVVGDTQDKNSGKGRFALYAGDATSTTLSTKYDGIRPSKGGYVPMHKQGSIILGIGGDNSDSDGGEWFEGVMASGAATTATLTSLQANIAAAGYGK
jgi:non-reducing end alpha-L-arabinofuranosidase